MASRAWEYDLTHEDRTSGRVFVIGDGPEIDPDKGGIETLACLRMHTDEGRSHRASAMRGHRIPTAFGNSEGVWDRLTAVV